MGIFLFFFFFFFFFFFTTENHGKSHLVSSLPGFAVNIIFFNVRQNECYIGNFVLF